MIGPHAVTHAIKDAAAAPAVAAVATASQANIQADQAIGPALARKKSYCRYGNFIDIAS